MVANDVFFGTLAALLIPFGVAILLAIAEKTGFIWAKLNQPTIAALVGAGLGAIYGIPSVHEMLNGHPPEAAYAVYLLGGVMAGLSGSGVKSLSKDVSSGAIKTTTREQVLDMRKNIQSKENIGA